MAVQLRVFADDLTTLIGTLDEPFDIAWSHELLAVGGGRFSMPHDSTVAAANSDLFDPENLVVVRVDGTDVFAFLIRSRSRSKGESFDQVDVAGPDAIELLSQAVVYPPNGLAGLLQDQRLFAWQTVDYVEDADWGDVTGVGTFASPSSSLLPTEADVDEVQRVHLYAESPPYPWGSDYPSPGGLPGTFSLSHRGQTTAALQWDASTADIETALEALPHIDGVTVTGATTSTFDVTFDGAEVGGQQQQLLKLNHSQLRHTAQASDVTRVTAGTNSVDGRNVIDGWPDPDAAWLGDFGELAHYRRVLDVEADDRAGLGRLFVYSQGPYDVWVDGDWVGSGNRDLLRVDVDLQDTDHVLSVRAEAPMILTLVRRYEDGSLGPVLYRSRDMSGVWQVYGPDEPPGVTPGFIAGTLFDEANARGYLPAVSTDFDATTDSLGNAWTVDIELGVQVGNDTVLSVAERLRDLDVFCEMTPDLTFRMWEGSKVDRSATVSFSAGDVHDLRWQTEDELLTALLIRTADSWVERHIAGVRREAFVSLGTVPTATGAQSIASEILGRMVDARESVTWRTYSDQTGVVQPSTNFDLADVVEALVLTSVGAASWSAGDVRIDTIAGEVAENGSVHWQFEGTPQ